MAVMETVEISAETPRAGGLRLSSAPLVARNAMFNTVSMLALAFIGLAFNPYIVSHLGHANYALFVYMAPIVSYYAMLDLGLGPAVMKYASEYYGRGDMERLSRLIGTANLLYMIIGSVGAAVVLLLTPWLATRWIRVGPEARADTYFCLYLASFGFFANMVLSVFNALPMALQRMDIGSARNTFVGLATSLGIVGLLFFHFGLREVMAWQVAWSAIGVWVFIVASRRLLPGVSFRPCFDREEFWRLYRFGRPTLLSSLGARLTAGFDRTLLGHFSMPLVTYYAIPMDVCQRGRSLTEQVTRALFPAVSDRSGNGDHEMVQRMYLRATRLLASAVIPILVMLGVFAFPVLNAWQGPSVAVPSAPVLMFAAAAFCFQFVGALQNMFLSATGRPNVMMWWNLAQGGAMLLFDMLLIPRYGAVGAAAALLIVSLGVIGPYTAYVASRVVGVSSWQVLKAFLPALALSTACFVPARPWLYQLHGFRNVAGACLGLGAAYALVAILLKVIPREDVKLVWGMVVKRGRVA